MREATGTRPTYLWDLAEAFLVHCPQCDEMGVVQARSENRLVAARLTCSSCGYARAWRPTAVGVVCHPGHHEFPEGVVVVGKGVDWYFHAPLWLETSCCGERLWAYNVSHLRWLRRYIAASLRPAARSEEGWANRSLGSRLPRWMKLAKNRDAVLRALGTLEARLMR
ncbi:MAG: hypothetical protein AAGA54_14940 [Myxococcota bacterium]